MCHVKLSFFHVFKQAEFIAESGTGAGTVGMPRRTVRRLRRPESHTHWHGFGAGAGAGAGVLQILNQDWRTCLVAQKSQHFLMQ